MILTLPLTLALAIIGLALIVVLACVLASVTPRKMGDGHAPGKLVSEYDLSVRRDPSRRIRPRIF